MITRFRHLPCPMLIAACLIACGGGGASPADAGARADGSSPNGELDAAVVDGTPTGTPTGDDDAGGLPRDAAPTTRCDLTETVRFSWAGGMRENRDLYTLAPPSALVITRIAALGPNDDQAGEVLCTLSLACDGKGVDPSGLVAALASADVVNAFQPTPTLFGVDVRLYDGAVLRVSHMDGRMIEIGDECPEPLASCKPITPALRALAEQLKAFMRSVRPGDAGQCATGP